MSRARNLADLLDANGDVASGALDNVPPADVVNDTTPQLGGDLASNGNDINFADNDKAVFGSGSDLQIYHDGSDSFIEDAGSGNLYIDGSNNIIVRDQANSDAWFMRLESGAQVQLHYAGDKKIETTSTGISVTGDISQSANANFRYEEMPFVSTTSSGWLTIFDLTIPSSGVWEITANPRLRYGSNEGFIGCALFDTSNNVISQLSMLTERHTVNTFGNLGAYASWVMNFGTNQSYPYSIRFRIYFESSGTYNANYNDSNGRPCITARKIRETTSTGVSEARSY